MIANEEEEVQNICQSCGSQLLCLCSGYEDNRKRHSGGTHPPSMRKILFYFCMLRLTATNNRPRLWLIGWGNAGWGECVDIHAPLKDSMQSVIGQVISGRMSLSASMPHACHACLMHTHTKCTSCCSGGPSGSGESSSVLEAAAALSSNHADVSMRGLRLKLHMHTHYLHGESGGCVALLMTCEG